MKIKNLIWAIAEQLTRPGAFANIFVTRNAWGIFSRYSHVSRRSGVPKVSYPSKMAAQKAADAMGSKRGVHFSVYKCAWCDGWHIGKNAQNKIPSPQGLQADGAAGFRKTNALFEHLKPLPIVDLAPVTACGVRGRTLSGRGSHWLLQRVRDAGVKVIIDLRTADQTDRFAREVRQAGMEYYSIPVDSRQTDVHRIIASLPLLFRLIDRGGFYLSCAMGLHRTDIALALYYVFHPSVPLAEVPEMRGHRTEGSFRCEDIAARLNSVMKALTADERCALGLGQDFEKEFQLRKKHLFAVNRVFVTER